MDDDELTALARRHIAIRRLRYDEFPSFLFDEYAWDMLLHLFVARAEGRSLDEATLGTLALATPRVWSRWLKHLEEQEHVERRSDGSVTLSTAAHEDMRRYLVRTADIHP